MKNLFILCLCALAIACATEKSTESKINPDLFPAAEGFNAAGSDSFAIALADSVALSMGGKRNYDSIRYINFNFFGARSHFWDKQEGMLRIESSRTDLKLIYDLKNDTGRVFMYGEEQTNPDSINKFLGVAKAMWINDTYWLLFPFKLKDSGVTLKYLGQKVDTRDTPCHAVELTFNEVGETPENKYIAYIHPDNYMVTQWDYYQSASDSIPAIVSPFEEYQSFDGIQISTKRGKYSFPEVAVFKSIPDSLRANLYGRF